MKYCLVILLVSVAIANATKGPIESVRDISFEYIEGHVKERISNEAESRKRCANAGMDCSDAKCCAESMVCDYSSVFGYYMCKVKHR
ncbi:unnamed protein product [Allacma fusca]|uniref:Uncharacterized protein n=1 Tax=Allacma fusca TaxID=39272 RepID=A0A8J2NWE9_9HEXA|nr:unnamed protein product [Allacma fusca]